MGGGVKLGRRNFSGALIDESLLYCGRCHKGGDAISVVVEYRIPRSPVVVTDMPAMKCPACGQVYIDVRQAETVEKIIQDRAGRLTMAEVLALGGVDEDE